MVQYTVRSKGKGSQAMGFLIQVTVQNIETVCLRMSQGSGIKLRWGNVESLGGAFIFSDVIIS